MTLFQEHLLQETDSILMEHDPEINTQVDRSLRESIEEHLTTGEALARAKEVIREAWLKRLARQ